MVQLFRSSQWAKLLSDTFTQEQRSMLRTLIQNALCVIIVTCNNLELLEAPHGCLGTGSSACVRGEGFTDSHLDVVLAASICELLSPIITTYCAHWQHVRSYLNGRLFPKDLTSSLNHPSLFDKTTNGSGHVSGVGNNGNRWIYIHNFNCLNVQAKMLVKPWIYTIRLP